MPRQQSGRWLLGGLLLVAIVSVVIGVWYAKTQPAPSVHVTPSSTTKKVSTPLSEEMCAPHEKLCFMYPKGWTVTTEQKDGGDMLVVQDAGKTMQLAFDSALSGVGGGQCEPGEADTVRVVRVQPTRIKVSESAAHEQTTEYVNAVAMVQRDAQKNRYVLRLLLTANPRASQPGEHDGCELRFAQFVGGRHVMTESGQPGLVSFVSGKGVRASDTQAAMVSFARPEEAEKALSLRTYSQAFDVLASAHYK